jgi:hypothetical protein
MHFLAGVSDARCELRRAEKSANTLGGLMHALVAETGHWPDG